MWLWWAPLAAVGLHISEEFVWPGGFGEWDRRYRPAIRASITPRLHVIVNLLLIFLCVSVALAGYGPKGTTVGPIRLRSAIPSSFSIGSWVALGGLLAGNAAFHVVGTIRSRTYSPGLVTALLAYVPLVALGVWQFVHTRELSPVAALGWLALGASYQLWATIGHRTRARRRATGA